MPYRLTVNNELPVSVRDHLSGHALDIYREAFNRAYAARAGEAECEKRAHMIAWAAVKRSYDKRCEQWVSRMVAAS